MISIIVLDAIIDVFWVQVIEYLSDQKKDKGMRFYWHNYKFIKYNHNVQI